MELPGHEVAEVVVIGNGIRAARTILPSTERGRGFDPGSVSVVAKRQLPDV